MFQILTIDREEAKNSRKQRVVCRCRKAKARRKSDKKRAMLDGFVNPPSTKKKLSKFVLHKMIIVNCQT